jgi:hypothetical protein
LIKKNKLPCAAVDFDGRLGPELAVPDDPIFVSDGLWHETTGDQGIFHLVNFVIDFINVRQHFIDISHLLILNVCLTEKSYVGL